LDVLERGEAGERLPRGWSGRRGCLRRRWRCFVRWDNLEETLRKRGFVGGRFIGERFIEDWGGGGGSVGRMPELEVVGLLGLRTRCEEGLEEEIAARGGAEETRAEASL
jgi:hypothetical protein